MQVRNPLPLINRECGKLLVQWTTRSPAPVSSSRRANRPFIAIRGCGNSLPRRVRTSLETASLQSGLKILTWHRSNAASRLRQQERIASARCGDIAFSDDGTYTFDDRMQPTNMAVALYAVTVQ